MIISLESEPLVRYVGRQLDTFFPDGLSTSPIATVIDEVLQRLERCFSALNNRYFRRDGMAVFDHLHSDQYAMFLYFLSNTLWRSGADARLCNKVYCLLKMMNSIDIFYEVALPDIFLLGHSIGSVLGRASYSDYLLVQQNCTIGASREEPGGASGKYPTIGRFVAVYKGASILGDCHIGENCKIAAHSILIDQDLPPDSLYIGTKDNHVIKPNLHHDNIWDPQ